MARHLVALIAIAGAVCTTVASVHASVPLTLNGQTDYSVVLPDAPSPVDEYSVETLVGYLKQMTGAEFPVVSAADADGVGPAIFVGLSDLALQRLGEQDPLADLEEQEHVARSKGADVFLYGKGIHGALHAVMLFLEEECDWRWYSVFEDPVLPDTPTLALEPFELKRGFSYAYRSLHIDYTMDFNYQHGANMTFDKKLRQRYGGADEPLPPRSERPYVSARNEMYGSTHTLHWYIPPSPNTKHAFPWLENRNYFETNPEYFSLWDNGRRVSNKQLCLSNPELRAELTRNVLDHIEREEPGLILELGAMDNPGPFCYCDGCKALEEKYGSPAGPIYDYLFELGRVLEEEHPDVSLRTFAYRRSQTQKPPVLPEGESFPPNLIIEFAPIEDNYFADWTHPDPYIQETYADLQAWAKIVHEGNLWSWIYPNPWRSGSLVPLGNIERLINNMRMMHEVGVRGFYIDHGHFHHYRSGWSELQVYLAIKLAQNINADTDAIIEEFMDHMYGAAAPLMSQYLEELEDGRKAMTDLSAQGYVATPGPAVTYKSVQFADHIFPYLTVENIHRWHTLFDDMEARVPEDDLRVLNNIGFARRELDFATLWKWTDLQEAHPDYYTDHRAIADRIAAINSAEPVPPTGRQPMPLAEGVVDIFVDIIETAGPLAPLPEPLDAVDAEAVVQFPAESAILYSRPGFRGNTARDAEAAGGLAVTYNVSAYPFSAGYFNEITDERTSIELQPEDVTSDGYELYLLGTVTAGREGYLWFDRSWSCTFGEVRELFDAANPEATWQLWASIRFEGPSFQDDAEADQKDRFFIDRIVCVPVDSEDAANARPGGDGAAPEFDFAQPD